MKNYTVEEIQARFKELGFTWHNCQLVGIRSREDKPDVFDDVMHVFNNEQHLVMPCTTNPGRYWLMNPMNPKGTAVVLANRQYTNLWKLGLHQGKYKALVQAFPIYVCRDADRDEKSEDNGPTDFGYFGINFHHANANLKSVVIGKWSAGCQVVPDPVQYQQAYDMLANSGNNFFTYTLLNEW